METVSYSGALFFQFVCSFPSLCIDSPNNLLEDAHVFHIYDTSVVCLFPIVEIIVVL